MIKRNKTITLSIAMAMAITMSSGVIEAGASKLTESNKVAVESIENEAYAIAVSEEEYSIPKQVNVHMGDDPSTQVNITYTTINSDLETKVEIAKK